MPKETVLSVRMDEDTRKEFDAFCSKVGLTASAAVNMFARAVLRERRIPFAITDETDLFYSESNMKILLESIAQLDAGKGFVRELIEVDDDE
jgi:DNA-damage-inducible protein J